MACSVNGQAPKRIMPPTYLLIGLIAEVVVRVALPGWAHPSWLAYALGAALLIAGVWLNLATDSAFKRAATPVSPNATPTTFVQGGVFRVTRNPMYLGMVLLVASAAVLMGEWVGLVVPALMLWALNRFFVPREELSLEGAFGRDYAAYRAEVPRWI